MLQGSWRDLGSNCKYQVGICLTLKSGSKLVASSNGLKVRVNYEVKVTVDGQCGRTFTAEEARKVKIYDQGIYDVTAMAGYTLTFEGGLWGKVTVTVPGDFEVSSQGSASANLGNPSMSTDGGFTVGATAEVWAGMQATAALIASISGALKASTTSTISVCQGGVSAGASMSASLEGSYSVNVPSITLAAGLCDQSAAISVSFNFKSLGSGFTKGLNAKSLTNRGQCSAPAGGYGSVCQNTCHYASDGDCDDGGPGSDYSVCAFGKDCTDCGPR